jgi:UDP-N-acetylglucosamine 4-epimerase
VNDAPKYHQTLARLRESPRTWLVTGAAGFIGSHLVETLVRADQIVVGLDNFLTGHQQNLDQIRASVSASQWSRFRFIEGDVRDPASCRVACDGVELVLHQAALGSVPRSIIDPITSHAVNVDGFVNMLVCARDARVRRFVYAASSSIYGDHPGLPKAEEYIGRPMSPYAVTKYVNELYADVFARTYGLPSIGLRYFNVFGPRQDPDGPYAAVIPKWIASLMKGEPVHINGDGQTTRDFCYVTNAVQANLLAATVDHAQALNQVYNVAAGDQTSLVQLYAQLRSDLLPDFPHLHDARPIHRDFRAGDVRHSLADISKARQRLGYEPTHRVVEGLRETVEWHTRTGASRIG